MRQPRINTSQVQYILSHKIFFEEFTPNKSYNKSIIIRHDNSLYLSKYEIAEKPTFDPNDWIKFSNAADLESLIQEEKERAIAVEISLRNDLDAEIIRASQAESDLDESKLNKILEANKIYATNNNNEQISIGYSSNNVVNTIVQRDNSGQINTALTPISDSNATSKKYVDDRIDAAISEAVVFKGIVENETELPSSGNTNGDMYWIRAFSDNPPAGMHSGRSGAAIYNGELEEFQFTEDAIYQPDNNTIELNSNGQLKVMVSVENNNSIEIKNDGLFVDISEKLDKIHSASKVYVTDNNGNQSNIGYDILNTANTIAQRDVNGQLNVNLTPTSNSNAASKKYVDDADSSLNTNKQNRPNNAIENNIAVFNDNKDTIDSGKSFITSINDSETASNTKVPTELAVRAELDNKVDKIDSASKVYITDDNGDQSSISYDISNTANTIVERDNNSQINIAQTPISDSHATSKKYVDDKVLDLDDSKQDRPDNAIENNIAIFNNSKDTIDSGKSFTTSISSNASDNKIPTELAVKNELDTKVDKIDSANQVYITSNSGEQSSISYDTANTANTIVRRDNNGQINVNLTPTANTNASSKKYVDDKVSNLDDSKQNRPNSVVENNIAIFNNNKDTIDSGKEFTTSINAEASDNKIPTELAVKNELDTKVDKNNDIVGATKTKITYDSKGLVTAGDNLIESDIPSIHLSKISDVTASASEVNVLDGITASTEELNYVDGVTSPIQTQLDDKVAKNNDIVGSTKTKITYDSKGLVTAGADLAESDIPNLHLSKITDVTATAAEINVLDGITASTEELNYVDGVTSPIQTQLDNKRDKVTSVSKVYVTDSNGNQSSISYDTVNTASTIVQRDNNSQINVALNPTANSHAASKKYVDDKIDSVISEAVVFKGIVANETLLPASGNNNGDMYWITAYSDNPPAGMTPGVSGSAIYKKPAGEVGEWNYTQDSIYQPDNKSIELDTNGQLTVKVSETVNNSLVKNNDGLYVDISGKLDKNSSITGATKTKITYDSKGLVTAGADLIESDIPSIHLSKISDVTATANELNVLDGITATTTELNYVDGVTSNIQTQLDNKVTKNSSITGATKTKITYDSKGLVTGGSNLEASDIPNLSLSKITDVTATAAEVNVLDGITASTEELNYVDGVTSSIQTQLDNKRDKVTSASKVYTTDGTGAQSSISYTTSDTASTIVQRDANKQINIAQTPTANSHAASKKYVDTEVGKKVTANSSITGDTKTKITYDSKGLVTTGADLEASDIPNLSLSKITDVTATAAEVNVLDGITATTTELNYVDGVTSPIQTQLNRKQATLISGTNIKTINNNSILGSGNLDIDGLPSQSGQSGKYLTTNGTTASWATVSQTLSGLTDTNISSATNGQVLTYDNSSSKWVNQTYYAMVIEDFTAS